jgi:hypothetical protein
MDRRVPPVGAWRAMSEYQYYKFRAVDQALTTREIGEFRAISSRAVICRLPVCLIRVSSRLREPAEVLSL